MLTETSALMRGIRLALRAEMQKRGRSTKGLAGQAEVGQPGLHRFLAGERSSMQAAALFSVAFALGKSPAWMIREGAKLAKLR